MLLAQKLKGLFAMYERCQSHSKAGISLENGDVFRALSEITS